MLCGLKRARWISELVVLLWGCAIDSLASVRPTFCWIVCPVPSGKAAELTFVSESSSNSIAAGFSWTSGTSQAKRKTSVILNPRGGFGPTELGSGSHEYRRQCKPRPGAWQTTGGVCHTHWALRTCFQWLIGFSPAPFLALFHCGLSCEKHQRRGSLQLHLFSDAERTGSGPKVDLRRARRTLSDPCDLSLVPIGL